MFTGIIRHIGTVTEVAENGQVLAVSSSLFESGHLLGDSVAISGVCLTVTKLSGSTAWFDLASETLRRTTLGHLVVSSRVNLERSLRLGDPLDGHMVQGHVDGVSSLLSRTTESGNTERMVFAVPEGFERYFAPKGSVTIDGVSLTVGEIDSGTFSVYIIPHTLQWTTLTDRKPGDSVNIEVDCVAKYLERLAGPYLQQLGRGER